nr:retrovirus-related Pol polyprotein from transposon TNT 1-94 [Tanacetum cinerariifolium]
MSPSVSKSRVNKSSHFKKPVPIQKWVAKLSTFPSLSSSCDTDQDVAFHSRTCYVQNLVGGDLLTGARDSNVYPISISELVASSLVYLMFKASSVKSCLWHRRLSHLNFATINQLTKQDMVISLLKSQYNKDYFCLACEKGKSKRTILKATLVYFIQTKDEVPGMIIMFITRIQVNLRATVRVDRTENGTEFKKEKLKSFYGKVSIIHRESITRTAKLNGVVKRRNRTLVQVEENDITEMIHVKFDELMAIAFEHNSLEPDSNHLNFEDPLVEPTHTPSTEDLHSLFGMFYDEYFEEITKQVSTYSVAPDNPNNDDTTSSTTIIVDEDKAPQIISASEEHTPP